MSLQHDIQHIENIMADSCSPSSDDNKSVHKSKPENSSTDEKIHVTISGNDKTNKPKMTSEQNRQLTDKLLEMEQIKCEERLVHEQINRLNAETQFLQNLLKILHFIDLNDTCHQP